MSKYGNSTKFTSKEANLIIIYKDVFAFFYFAMIMENLRNFVFHALFNFI